MRKVFVLLASLVFLASCSKPSELFLYIKLVEYDWKSEYVPGNSSVRINLFGESQSSVINRVQIQTHTSDGNDYTVIDTFLVSPVRKLDMNVPYIVPTFYDTTTVEVRTTMWTQNGETGSYTFVMRVLPSETELNTYDSKTMYSAASHGASAFNWDVFEPYYPDSTITPDLSFQDVLSEDTVTLSCSWSSQSLLFARFEGFNFAQATLRSLEQAYDNCSPTNRIQNIHEDDIILIGNAQGALGVVKVILVSDKEGVEQDRYVFSIKARK